MSSTTCKIHKDGGENEWRRAAKMRDDEFTRNVDEFPKREMCGVEREEVSQSQNQDRSRNVR